MKKVILFMLVAVLGLTTANAQDHFKAGDKTLSGQLTGFDFSYTKIDKSNKLNVDLSIYGSYFVIDNLAITAGVGINSEKQKDVDGTTGFNFSIGARYYFYDALYAGVAYKGYQSGEKDAKLESRARIEVGYDYYLSDNVFFEPAIYFEKGFGDIDKLSQFGLAIGIGVNF
ncbi:MAG: hypothetical protein LBN18_00910 [Dysgonamonadaceae bacterium]|jgi:opacity protein-like surface antigen|nr:hypothetical protein [Dysgonamonadaceae bacterium]